MQLIKGSNYTCLGGWVAGSDSDNRANLRSAVTEVGLPTWTELGNTQVLLENFSKLGGMHKIFTKVHKKVLNNASKISKTF